ncbi:MAG: class II glutamine amidotransferase [Bacteroidales bacterium]|nr:class II glutamine amidotransferase [Bacteroidales bacterium]
MKEIETVSESENCIIHFRFATTGSIKPANAHPFRCKDVYFAHNGVLRIETQNDKTDSETFFEQTLYPAIDRYGIASKEVSAIMKPVSLYSRFALMQGETLKTFGGFTKYEGCYYSNLRFIDYLIYQSCEQENFYPTYSNLPGSL